MPPSPLLCMAPARLAPRLSAVIAGPDEFAKGVWKVKDLAKRE